MNPKSLVGSNLHSFPTIEILSLEAASKDSIRVPVRALPLLSSTVPVPLVGAAVNVMLIVVPIPTSVAPFVGLIELN